jgi:hypothetical protein
VVREALELLESGRVGEAAELLRGALMGSNTRE